MEIKIKITLGCVDYSHNIQHFKVFFFPYEEKCDNILAGLPSSCQSSLFGYNAGTRYFF